MRHTRYILVDEKGEAAFLEGFAILEDEDSETLISAPITSATAQGMIEAIADWLSVSTKDVKSSFNGSEFTVDDTTYTIKKEIVNEVELDENDLRDFKYQLSLKN